MTKHINHDTGEIMNYEPSEDDLAKWAISEIPEFDLGSWGTEALDKLRAIEGGRHYRKQRRTILRLAEAAYLNLSQRHVFGRDDVASRVSHYKWRKTDEAYEEAYNFLVGSAAEPGLARLRREQEQDEDEALAISALVEARTLLRLNSAEAVRTLVNALDASDKYGALWRERIVAANSILDRADTETAARQAPAVSLVDKAIMTVYASIDAGNQVAGQPALPAGQQVIDQDPTADMPSDHVSEDDEASQGSDSD